MHGRARIDRRGACGTRGAPWLLVALVGCASNPGVPGYPTAKPPALARARAPRPADSVRVALAPLPWWTLAGTDEQFILGFDEAAAPPAAGRLVGPVRSPDLALTGPELAAVRCAWMIVPMGDPRPCLELGRADAMALAKDPIDRALGALRTRAGVAGADLVGEIRCFAAARRAGAGHLWCEGVAVEVEPRRPTLGAEAASSVAAPIAHEPRSPGTRLVLHADGSAGLLGRVPVVGATLGLRYRPIEVGLYVLDLGREDRQRGLVGVGLSALARVAVAGSRFDAIAGLSALAVAPNDRTNPDLAGLYQGFVGIAYQTPWRVAGAAQPFVQLRVGLAHGTDLAAGATPIVELHLGLSTPERR